MIYQVIGPLGMKFTQQLTCFPNSKRVDRVTVSFKKEDYVAFNIKMKGNGLENRLTQFHWDSSLQAHLTWVPLEPLVYVS